MIEEVYREFCAETPVIPFCKEVFKFMKGSSQQLVFLTLLSKTTSRSNVVSTSIREIARINGLAIKSISLAVKQLISLGLVKADIKVGNASTSMTVETNLFVKLIITYRILPSGIRDEFVKAFQESGFLGAEFWLDALIQAASSSKSLLSREQETSISLLWGCRKKPSYSAPAPRQRGQHRPRQESQQNSETRSTPHK